FEERRREATQHSEPLYISPPDPCNGPNFCRLSPLTAWQPPRQPHSRSNVGVVPPLTTSMTTPGGLLRRPGAKLDDLTSGCSVGRPDLSGSSICRSLPGRMA